MSLRRSLDCLENVPRIWYDLLNLQSTEAGLVQLKRMPCVPKF